MTSCDLENRQFLLRFLGQNTSSRSPIFAGLSARIFGPYKFSYSWDFRLDFMDFFSDFSSFSGISLKKGFLVFRLKNTTIINSVFLFL